MLPLSGDTVTSVAIAQDLSIEGEAFRLAGQIVALSRITGGTVVAGHPGCGDRDPHLHSQGGIFVDGLGPFPDPNPSGCGYGVITEVPVEHTD